MKKVRDFRVILQSAIDRSDSDAELRKFLRNLADFDDMNIEDFFRRLRGEAGPAATAQAPLASVPEIVSRLKSAMPDDSAFHREIGGLARRKAVTKPLLTQVFYSLFERTQGVPKKITRAELLRLIEDERNIIVRNEKMGQMLGRRIVPAE